MLGDFNMVTVIQGSMRGGRDCSIKRCKCRDTYMIFNDDGATLSSRLFACSCKKHLAAVVDKAWAENHRQHLTDSGRLSLSPKATARA